MGDYASRTTAHLQELAAYDPGSSTSRLLAVYTRDDFGFRGSLYPLNRFVSQPLNRRLWGII